MHPRNGVLACGTVGAGILVFLAACGSAAQNNSSPASSVDIQATIQAAVQATVAGKSAVSPAPSAAVSAPPPTDSVPAKAPSAQSTAVKFTNDNWGLALSDANKYKGSPVALTGKVFQVEHDGDTWAYQMYTNTSFSDGNTIVGMKSAADPGIARDDYVSVEGTVGGVFEGKNAFGASLRVPQVLAQKITKGNPDDVIAPAIKTIAVNEEQKQSGIALALLTVDLAKVETRLHVSVRNEAPTKATVYPSEIALVQGSKQMKPTSSYDRKYAEIPSTMLPGVEVKTTILFDGVDPSGGPVQMVWSGVHTDNYSVHFKDYVWSIKLS